MGARRNDREVREHLDEIFVLARKSARSQGANTYEADEVAQWTAYKLWRRWDDDHVAELRGIGGTRWRSYIRKVARNCHIDLIREHQRRQARQRRAYENQLGRPLLDDDTLGNDQSISASNVESWVAREFIGELIQDLPEKQREVGSRIFLLEMTAAEVARELGMQAQTVRKHARLARETLKTRLSEIESQTR